MDGARKILNAIKQVSSANQNATSDIVSLKVKSVDPLVFENENRLPIDKNFYSLSKLENWNQLQKGDIIRAFKMNNGQAYYAQEILKGEGSSDNLKNIEDVLANLANEVSLLVDEVDKLKDVVKEQDARITALEGKVG